MDSGCPGLGLGLPLASCVTLQSVAYPQQETGVRFPGISNFGLAKGFPGDFQSRVGANVDEDKVGGLGRVPILTWFLVPASALK